MTLTKEIFIAQLDRAALSVSELPVSSALLRCLSDELKKGDPPWWKKMLEAWKGRNFFAWTEAWGLFLTAIHYEALSDAHSPLAAYFPSCGGTDEADPSQALLEFLAAPPPSFFDHLKTAQRRTYVSFRSPLWLGPAALFFQKKEMPFYVAETGSGAGLNLAIDHIEEKLGFDSELISARIGLDENPLDIASLSDRRWLTAALMPEQMDLIADLDRAIEIVREKTRSESDFIQLVSCETMKSPQFLEKNIPADDPDVGLLVLNMGVTVRMDDSQYAAYVQAMGQMLKVWGERALWVEVESVRGEIYSMTYQLRAHRWKNSAWQSRILASFDFAQKQTRLDQKENAEFLS